MRRFFKTPAWKLFVGSNHSHFRYFFLILIPHLVSALLEGASFAFILLAFSALEKKPNYDFHIIPFKFAKEFLSTLTEIQFFYFFILSAIFSQLFRSLVSYISLYNTSSLGVKIQTDAQRAVLKQIFRFSYAFISRLKTGELNEYIKNPSIFIPIFFDTLNRILVSSFMIFGLISILCWISPALTILTVILFGIFSFAQKKIISKLTKNSIELSSHLFEFSHQTIQALQGIRPIYIFQKQNYFLKKSEKILTSISSSAQNAYRWNNLVPVVNETVSILLVGTVLIFGSLIMAQTGQAILSSLLTYIALTYRLATRLQIFMGAVSTIGMYCGALFKLNEILEEKDKEFLPMIDKHIDDWDHNIEFQDVSLQYPQTAKLALNKISFSVKKGTTVALVGPSGAGKSSVLDVLLGLQKLTSGKVLIDSKNLFSFSSDSWLKRVGVVSQDIFIFNDTIEENIRFGDYLAKEADIKLACDLAGASDFIKHLPQQFQTLVGEKGHILSGGERQRIALARTLLRNPEIIILDEATSNLDSYSEKKIQLALEQLKKDKTLMIVAHRLSTIIHADQILVLENGEIIERGTHENLIAQNGLYAKLWELQSERVSTK
jgi:subfamily B ATP-binding cassette protein MsbA